MRRSSVHQPSLRTADIRARKNLTLAGRLEGKTYSPVGQQVRGQRLLTILSDGSIGHGDAAGNDSRRGDQSTRFRRRRRRQVLIIRGGS